MKLGFWISILSRIPDSWSCIPDSKAQDSGLHKQNFLRFLNPDKDICTATEVGESYGRSVLLGCDCAHVRGLTLNKSFSNVIVQVRRVLL